MDLIIELVPRDTAALLEETELALANGGFSGINIPDLPRLSTRSWDAARLVRAKTGRVIPHIRACDFAPGDELPFKNELMHAGITELLAIQGDPVEGKPSGGMTTPQFIRRLKAELPGVKVYAALDAYRWDIKREIDYLKEKEEAGAEGFFTQPFFDLRLLEIYAEKLTHLPVYWGISPVVTEKSREYWESRNRAHFPADFQPTMDWNTVFARRALNFCRDCGGRLYFMPIKINLKEYLGKIFLD